LTEDDEVEPGEKVDNAALAAGAGVGFDRGDQVDDIEDA